MVRHHARIIQHPFATSLQGALLDSYQEERRGKQLHLTLNIRSLDSQSLNLSSMMEPSMNAYKEVMFRQKYISLEYRNSRAVTFS